MYFRSIYRPQIRILAGLAAATTSFPSASLRALIHAKAIEMPLNDIASRKVSVAVIGCGVIGESWSALFLTHGHDVYAWDPSPEVRAQFAPRLERPLAQLAQLDPKRPPRGTLRMVDTAAQAVATVELVQENAPERVPLKRALYADIESAAPETAIIASSTSALTWSELSSEMRHAQRFITAHPFNPPHLVPLVELFGIDNEVLSRAEAIYRGLDRVPVRLKKDAVGHIANRLSSALWREAVHLVAEGIADVADIDQALVNGPGLRWSVIGAHMVYHLGGGEGGIQHYLKHLGPSQVRRWGTLGSPQLTPEVQERLIAGIAAEAGGRSVAELEQARDAELIRILRARREVT
jgi:carnitine 3-dehydrogenase